MSSGATGETIMEEKKTFHEQIDLAAFEERYALWKQSYQQHVQLLDEFYQWRSDFLLEKTEFLVEATEEKHMERA
jgi:hypothetical protein